MAESGVMISEVSNYVTEVSSFNTKARLLEFIDLAYLLSLSLLFPTFNYRDFGNFITSFLYQFSLTFNFIKERVRWSPDGLL